MAIASIRVANAQIRSPQVESTLKIEANLAIADGVIITPSDNLTKLIFKGSMG